MPNNAPGNDSGLYHACDPSCVFYVETPSGPPECHAHAPSPSHGPIEPWTWPRAPRNGPACGERVKRRPPG